MVLKIRYDLETLSQKQHHIDRIINDMNLKIKNNETITTVIYSNQVDDCDSSLPISMKKN